MSTRLKTVILLIIVVLAGIGLLAIIYGKEPVVVDNGERTTGIEPGIYAEVPALGADNPGIGCVSYIGTEEERRQKAIANILAERGR